MGMDIVMRGMTQNPSSNSNTDNNDYNILLGRQSEQIVSEFHGKYYVQTQRGNMFIATSSTAAAIPVTTTTSPNFALWNPAGSGKNVVLVRYAAGWNATTEAPGSIAFMYALNAGNTVATGAIFTAYANTTPLNALLGAGNTNQARFSVAATATAAGTMLETLGLSHLTTTGTATFGSFTYIIDFDGQLILPPGTAIWTAATTATASTYNQTIKWYEAPI